MHRFPWLIAMCLATIAVASPAPAPTRTSALTGIALAPGATRLGLPSSHGLSMWVNRLARQRNSTCATHEFLMWDEQSTAEAIGQALKTGWTNKKLRYMQTHLETDATATVREFYLTGTGVRLVGLWIDDTGGSILAWCTLKP